MSGTRAQYGWDVRLGGFDWAAFRAKMDAELDRLETAYRGNLARSGATGFDARATLVDPHTVELSDGQRLSAAHILIATGGHPFVPDFRGLRSCDDLQRGLQA